MVEQIKDENGIIICHIIRGNYSPATTEFFTPDNYSQQLGIIKYPEGGAIKPHFHNKLAREVFFTQEVLVIRKGKVKVNLYNNQSLSFLTSVVLNSGDTILLASGGHGFEMLEDTEMLEIKQGPYSGVTNDKTNIQ
jgi:hypothetical protein